MTAALRPYVEGGGVYSGVRESVEESATSAGKALFKLRQPSQQEGSE